MFTYEIARDMALSGDYTFLSEILEELRVNYSGTYMEVIKDIKEHIEWNKEEECYPINQS